jgi:CBS domain-containing protein
MKAQEIMTGNPAVVTSDDSIEKAARLMQDNDCGCIPVVDAGSRNSVVGVITDRDIAIRGVGRGLDASTRVREIMTPDPHTVSSSADVKDVERIMSDRQVRRVVVVDDDGQCVGIVAQADLARGEARAVVDESDLARVVERISEPAPHNDWHS